MGELQDARLPRLVRRALFAALVLCLTLSAFLVLRGFASGPSFLVRHVEIEGNEQLSRAEVLTILGLDRPRSIWSLDEEAMRASLMRSRWVRDVELRVSGRGRVWVSLREAKAEAVVVADQLYLMASDGEVIEPISSVPEGLPLWVGLVRTNGDAEGLHLDGVLLRHARQLQELWADSRWGQLDPLDELHHEDLYGFTVLTRAGLEVELGWPEHWVSRLRRLEQLEEQLAGSGAVPVRIEFVGDRELRLFFARPAEPTAARDGEVFP